MKVLAIIQARMNSSRLPGKVLKKINGKSLLLHQLDRLMNCKNIDQIVIATTINPQDDEIERFCIENNVNFYRGSEDDVLGRYYETWKEFDGNLIVRLTSDCPLIDFKVVDKIIQYFLDNSFDYVSNTIERTFPRGLDTEVFTSNTLEKAFMNSTLQRDREHVTAYIYTHPEKFRIGSYIDKKDNSFYRWTVDTKEDFELIRNILEAKSDNGHQLDYLAILKLMDENPEWRKINEHIEQKKI